MHEQLTREIDDGPKGARIGAFFDVDRTLIAGFSALQFMRHGLRSGLMNPGDFAEAVATAVRFQLGQTGFSGFVTGTAGMLRGRTETELEEMGEQIFTERLATEIYPESRALVQAHRHRGHTLAVVSAATRYQIEPLARELEIPHVLCTRLQVRKGRFTGKVIRPTCYGEGKAQAVRDFAAAHDVDLARSYFYSDSDEDLALLD